MKPRGDQIVIRFTILKHSPKMIGVGATHDLKIGSKSFKPMPSPDVVTGLGVAIRLVILVKSIFVQHNVITHSSTSVIYKPCSTMPS